MEVVKVEVLDGHHLVFGAEITRKLMTGMKYEATKMENSTNMVIYPT